MESDIWRLDDREMGLIDWINKNIKDPDQKIGGIESFIMVLFLIVMFLGCL